MQRAAVNLFADMGNVQPATLMDGLTPATQTTDTSPPITTITSPSLGATFRTVRPLLLTESGWPEVNSPPAITDRSNPPFLRSLLPPDRPLLGNRHFFQHPPAEGDESHHHYREQPATADTAQHQRHRQRLLFLLWHPHL